MPQMPEFGQSDQHSFTSLVGNSFSTHFILHYTPTFFDYLSGLCLSQEAKSFDFASCQDDVLAAFRCSSKCSFHTPTTSPLQVSS